MSNNIIVYDIETKNSFDDVGGRQNLIALEISVLAAYDYLSDKYTVYEENELPKFAERLSSKPLLVGFNIKKFDNPILQKYLPFSLKNFPLLDIMDELVKVLGHRVSLDSVASATIGSVKSGNGLDAIRFWREGNLERLKSYCLDDVKLTKKIYEYGAENKKLYYTSKYAPSKKEARINWDINRPENDKSEKQGILF